VRISPWARTYMTMLVRPSSFQHHTAAVTAGMYASCYRLTAQAAAARRRPDAAVAAVVVASPPQPPPPLAPAAAEADAGVVGAPEMAVVVAVAVAVAAAAGDSQPARRRAHAYQSKQGGASTAADGARVIACALVAGVMHDRQASVGRHGSSIE